MKITEIYKKYSIPQNLQEHMLGVAALGKIICDHLRANINSNLVVKTLLLHDMGNLVKFDLSNTAFFAKNDLKNLNKYQTAQKEFFKKYGKKADRVTLKIMRELGCSQQMINLCRDSHGQQSAVIAQGDDYQKKIAYYSDMRLSPKGIIPLPDRFQDLMLRYPQERQFINSYLKNALTIETQLQKQTSINLQQISNQQLKTEFNKLKEICYF